MIVLICVKEETGSIIVSHGINSDTMRDVILPQVPPSYLGAKFNHDIGEWVIYED